KNRINHRLQFSRSSPVECRAHVGTVATVAADEPMLFHEEGPEVEGNFASCGRAAGHDRSAAREAVETFLQDIAADVFRDYIHAVSPCYPANCRRPIDVGVEHEFGAELRGQCALRFG